MYQHGTSYILPTLINNNQKQVIRTVYYTFLQISAINGYNMLSITQSTL
jgi:hypothetical protein